MFTLVAAAGLLAGYSLSAAEHVCIGKTRQMWAPIRLSNAQHMLKSNYTVLSADSWSRSPWGKSCSTAAAHTPNQASGLKQMCRLPDLWRNCSKGIYLDIGSNVGVQIRKLYDAHQFPKAPVLPVFDKVFGSHRAGVCAVGVEANPHHSTYLQTLNSYFEEQGYQAIILTEVAASIRSGSASFFLDPNSPVEWGASLKSGIWQPKNNGTIKADVDLLNLPAWVVDVVRPILQQELQNTGEPPTAGAAVRWGW